MVLPLNTYNLNTVHNSQQNVVSNLPRIPSANGVPITNQFISETQSINRQTNNLQPNYMKKVYSPYLSPSNGSTTESFLKSKISFSPAFQHNEKATRYQMVSEINQKLYKMQKKIDLFI